MKKIIFAIIIISCFVSCGGKNTEDLTMDFLDTVKSGKLDDALSKINNEYDLGAVDRIKGLFEGRTIKEYNIIKDDDPKAAAAENMGLGMTEVEIIFSNETVKMKFLSGKKEGKLCLTNITEQY